VARWWVRRNGMARADGPALVGPVCHAAAGGYVGGVGMGLGAVQHR